MNIIFIRVFYKMSKSTPISNLPNLKKQSGQAFEQRENEIVKEILNEIDSEVPKAPPAQATPQPSPEEIAQRQAMIQQQMMEQQMMEQQMMEQKMMEQQMAAAANSASTGTNSQINDVENIVAKNEEKPFFDELLEKLKPSIVVGVIVALLSLPFVGDMISKIVNSKESLKKMALPLTLVIKALLGSALFFGSSGALNA